MESDPAIVNPINQRQAEDPFFVSSTESVTAPLVNIPLFGLKNFISWKRGMERALGIKSKLGFVRGDFPKPTDSLELTRWERCNSVILTWIINSVSPEIAESINHCADCIQAWSILHVRFSGSNGPRLLSLHREITNLTQGDMSVGEYHGKLIKMWADEESLEQDELCDLGLRCKSTRSIEVRRSRSRVIQFLMGLNSVHDQVRTNIVSFRPMPTVDEAYNMVLEDEMQKGIVNVTASEASVLYVSQGQTGVSGNQQGKNKRNSNLFCTHCQMKGHTKERCYKIHGYPPGHKLHNAGSSNGGKPGKSVVNNVVVENPKSAGESLDAKNQLDSLKINQAQLDKLMSFLTFTDKSFNHMAGISCLTSVKIEENVWIMDSGATDHITPHAHLLQNIKTLQVPYSVGLPNGNTVLVQSVGECQINEHLKLSDVLLIPSFKFNLMSVWRVTSDYGGSVHFTDSCCYI